MGESVAMKHVGHESQWPKTVVEWTEGDTAYLSVAFTWDLPKAHMRAVWLREQRYEVEAGGPACLLMPDYLSEVAKVNGKRIDALWRHNPDATFTSRGCIRRCEFCAVPVIEGDLVELDHWEPKPIVCDNNLLACSPQHFDKVIDSLKGIEGVDFNQGLDARLLQKWHARRLAELDLAKVRLAWDWTSLEGDVLYAIGLFRDAGIPKSKIGIYCLIGFHDTPEDALYRLETIRGWGILPNPQRYNPLGTLTKDSYVGAAWTDKQLTRYMRYWYQPRVWAMPFEEFDMREP